MDTLSIAKSESSVPYNVEIFSAYLSIMVTSVTGDWRVIFLKAEVNQKLPPKCYDIIWFDDC